MDALVQTLVQGVWSLRPSSSDEHHKYLVLTFARETRVLALNMVRALRA